jgi:MFS transporter, PAT family, beta-lactamase induction signal transducer AmpG
MTIKQSKPWYYIPTLYFLEGVPYVTVNTVSMVMFKKLGVPNGDLAFWTSIISWPWTLKMLWGPMIDRYGTKRNWIMLFQLIMVLLMLGLAWLTSLSLPWTLSLILLGLMAFMSASHDIAADGFYMLALSEKDQSFFIGIRSTAYRLATIFGSGFLIYLAGRYEKDGLSAPDIWMRVLLVGAAVFLLGFSLGALFMPKPEADRPIKRENLGYKVFADYFMQPKIFTILGFILFYRFGESMVGKMSQLFLLDSVEKGGLGISTEQVGIIGGVVGVISLTLGGIVGGLTLAKWGLKRSLWPMVFSMNLPNFLYWYASLNSLPKWAIYGIVGIDQFGYGFGFAAYMVYLMFIAQDSDSKSAHFAISTGLMAFGAIIAGAVSGYAQEWLGYSGFFLATIVCSIPGIIILKFLPLDKKDLYKVQVDLN